MTTIKHDLPDHKDIARICDLRKYSYFPKKRRICHKTNPLEQHKNATNRRYQNTQ